MMTSTLDEYLQRYKVAYQTDQHPRDPKVWLCTMRYGEQTVSHCLQSDTRPDPADTIRALPTRTLTRIFGPDMAAEIVNLVQQED